MKIVIALLAFFCLTCTLILSFLAGGVVGVGVGYEAGLEDNGAIQFVEGWEDYIDTGEPMPVGQMYDLEVLERDAHDRDVFTHFTVSSESEGCVTITSGDYQARIVGDREKVGDAMAVLYFGTASAENQDLVEQALVYSLHKMGAKNASTYLGLRRQDADYPQYPEAEFSVYYTSKLRGLLAERYPLL